MREHATRRVHALLVVVSFVFDATRRVYTLLVVFLSS
jgi:hypothetical protein